MKKKMNRRQFLKTSGKTVATAAFLNGPFALLMDAITQGAIARAYAESVGATPRKWVDMRYYGSPPRWVYDLVLKNSAADDANFVPGVAGSQLANKLILNGSGRYTTAVYSTVRSGDVRLPYMWQFSVPTAAGGTRPMMDLLQNFLNIRGIDAGNAGHNGAESLHFRPQGATKSLPALTADPSAAPISAVYNSNSFFSFYSEKGKSPMLLTGNYLTALTAPFQPSTGVATVRAREAMLKAYVDATRTALKNKQIANHPDASRIKLSITAAQSMMAQALSTMTTQYTALQTKYRTLINTALGTTLVGINDYPIGTLPAASRDLHHRVNNRMFTGDDLRTLVDPRRATKPTNADLMADVFAITEFILANGFSESITMAISPLANLLDGTAGSAYGFDEHFTGVLPSILINTMFSFAHAACMLELISRLKTLGLWNETVINVGSEFNRAPRNDGFGADHGSTGMSLQLYSGCIPGPMILGNIASNAYPAGYVGSWGAGAPVPEVGTKLLEQGHAMNTIASLLRVPAPVAARQALVDGSGTTAVATIPAGKIVV